MIQISKVPPAATEQVIEHGERKIFRTLAIKTGPGFARFLQFYADALPTAARNTQVRKPAHHPGEKANLLRRQDEIKTSDNPTSVTTAALSSRDPAAGSDRPPKHRRR